MSTPDCLRRRRARNSDPDTSHAAADAAEQLAVAHSDQILACLEANGPLGKDGIARITGISGVAVARRLPELMRATLAQPTGEKAVSDTGRPEREWASSAWLRNR